MTPRGRWPAAPERSGLVPCGGCDPDARSGVTLVQPGKVCFDCRRSSDRATRAMDAMRRDSATTLKAAA